MNYKKAKSVIWKDFSDERKGKNKLLHSNVKKKRKKEVVESEAHTHEFKVKYTDVAQCNIRLCLEKTSINDKVISKKVPLIFLMLRTV